MNSLRSQAISLFVLGLAILSTETFAGVSPHSVFRDGREFAPEQQIMLMMRVGSPGSEAIQRNQEYKKAKSLLTELYPWRQVLTIETHTPEAFWRSYQEQFSYLGDVVITQVLLLTESGPLSVKKAGQSRIIYRAGDKELEAGLIDGQIQHDALVQQASQSKIFPKLGDLLSDEASATVIHTRSDPRGARDFLTHQFYAHLFGVRAGSIAIVNPSYTPTQFTVMNSALNLMLLSGAIASGYAATLPPIEGTPITGMITGLIVSWIAHEILGDDTAERWLPGTISTSQVVSGIPRMGERLSSRDLRRGLARVTEKLCDQALRGLSS